MGSNPAIPTSKQINKGVLLWETGPNYVPKLYRNIINPWMTESEIRRAIQYVERLIKLRGLQGEDLERFLALHVPDRDWSKKR